MKVNPLKMKSRLAVLLFALPILALGQFPYSKALLNLAFDDKPSDLESYFVTFELLSAYLAQEMGYDNKRLSYTIPVNNQKIGFGTLPNGTLAQARRVNNDCEIYVVINRNEWFNAPPARRLWIYWHELGHDAYNLNHGEGGELMNAYAPNERITPSRLFNAFKEMTRYALIYGKYARGGFCMDDEIYYFDKNPDGSYTGSARTKDGKIYKSKKSDSNSNSFNSKSNSNKRNSYSENNAIAVTSFYLADSRGEDTELIVKKGQALYVIECGSSLLSLCKIKVNGHEGYAMKNSFEYN